MLSQRFLVVLCLVSLLAVCSASAADRPQPVKLSLKKAMAMTISNNLDLQVDALDSSMSESDIKRNKSIYDPFLGLSVSHGQTFYTGETYGVKDTTTSFGITQYLPSGGSLSASSYTGYSKPVSDDPDDTWTDWYTSVGVTLSQPLLKNFGKESTELNISLAVNDHEASLEQFRESVIDTVYEVIKAYNRLYTLRQVLDSKRQSLDSARRLLDKIQQASPGVQQEVGFANTEYTISQRLKDLVNAERDIKDQEARLRYLIGEQRKLSLTPVDPPSGQEPAETTEQAIRLALENRSDLKQLRLDLTSSELEERVSKRRLLPNLSVNGSVGFRGIEDQFSDSVEQIAKGKGQWWSAGLQFSVPLGNHAAKSDYRRNRLRTKQLRSSIKAFEWQLRDDIEADMRSLLSARVQRQVAEKSFAAATRRYEKYRNGVDNDTANVKDLLDAENDLVNARNNQTEALEDFSNAVARLWKDAGVLLERLNIHIDTRQPEQLTTRTERIAYPLPSPQQLAERGKVSAASLLSASTAPGPTSQQAASVTTSPQVPSAVTPVVERHETVTEPVIAKAPTPSPVPAVDREKHEDSDIYTLMIGEYVSSELGAAKKKLKKAGLTPQVAAGSKRPRQVVRLKIADYQTLSAAKKELTKLADSITGGFIIKLGTASFRLYAGSFFSRTSALKEQQRLSSTGVSLSLEETTVQLPTALLTAGRFTDRQAALATAQKLEKLGVNAVVEKAADLS